MKKKNKNKNIIIVILILMIVGLSGYLVYDKLFNDDCVVIDNNKNNDKDEISKVEDKDVSLNEEDDNSANKDNTDNDIDVTNSDKNNEYLGYDMSKVSKYKNKDGSYGIIKSLSYDNLSEPNATYSITLDLDGNVIYKYKNGDNYQEVILLANAIDTVSFYKVGGDFGSAYCYMLDNNGNVFQYKLTDIIGEEWPIKKLNVSNVNRLMTVNVCGEQACSWMLVAVTNKGDIIELNQGSV